MFKFGTRSQEKLLMVEDEIQKLCDLALRETTVDFSIIDGFRTVEDQQEMFNKGVSNLDGINKKSAHQSGLAIDVIPYVKGIDIWDADNLEAKAAWFEVHRAFLRAARLLKYNIELGVSYNIGGGRDYPHIQINKG